MRLSSIHRWSIAGLLVVLGWAPAVAMADIFKCVAKNGLPLYQNFPCQFDSLSLLGTLGTAPVSPVNLPPLRLHPSTATAIATPPHTGATEPGAGMTSDEIWAMLGSPVEVVPIYVSRDGPGEIWRYVDKRIRFNDNQVVLTIER